MSSNNFSIVNMINSLKVSNSHIINKFVHSSKSQIQSITTTLPLNKIKQQILNSTIYKNKTANTVNNELDSTLSVQKSTGSLSSGSLSSNYSDNHIQNNRKNQQQHNSNNNLVGNKLNELSTEEQAFKQAPINWIPATVLISTPIAAAILTPWYLATHKVKAPVWITFAATAAWTGLSITAGYHRLMSHRSYKAHPVVRNFFLVGATLAVQGSAFDWCSGHRTHHKHVDDVMQDPYSVKRGFWFSHIGWMLRNYPSGNFNYKNIPDLTKDKVLQIHHKYYGIWVLASNIGLIGAIGWLIGDVWSTLLLAGLLRLVINHHFTFFINSLCHMYGTRPYTDTNTARDNFLLAIPTWGEGYHNYHHIFQYDYRNGVKWWQYDPTKWLIAALEKLGLASDLRVVDDIKIKYAEVQMQFKYAQQKLDSITNEEGQINDINLPTKLQTFSDRIQFELQLFNDTVKEWQDIKAKAIKLKKDKFSERLQEVDEMLKDQYSLIENRILNHNRNLKRTFAMIDYKTS